MLVLDLCSGSGSATAAFKDRGHEVHTLDLGIDYPEQEYTFKTNVLYFKPRHKYDFTWSSPPCTCFSVASIVHHWTDKKPNPETVEAIRIVEACLKIAEQSRFKVIENPMGMLRTVDMMKNFKKRYFLSTVTYCQYQPKEKYGLTAMKPTDLWHNIPYFIGKKCNYGARCHVRAPRHTRNPLSTQNLPFEERAKIPYRLSLEICQAVERALIDT